MEKISAQLYLAVHFITRITSPGATADGDQNENGSSEAAAPIGGSTSTAKNRTNSSKKYTKTAPDFGPRLAILGIF